MDIEVILSKQARKYKARTYHYWYMRWCGSDGKRRGKSLGRTDKMSERQARKLCQQKEIELRANPGRRDVSRSPLLGEFVKRYLDDRKNELAAGTLELHERTGRYLVAHFGENRRMDSISRVDARAFKTALGSESFGEKIRGPVDRQARQSGGAARSRRRRGRRARGHWPRARSTSMSARHGSSSRWPSTTT